MATRRQTRKAEPEAVEAEIPSTLARRVLAELVNRAEYAGRRTAITRRGRVIAAIVSATDLAFLDKNRPTAAA